MNVRKKKLDFTFWLFHVLAGSIVNLIAGAILGLTWSWALNLQAINFVICGMIAGGMIGFFRSLFTFKYFILAFYKRQYEYLNRRELPVFMLTYCSLFLLGFVTRLAILVFFFVNWIYLKIV